MTPLSNTMIAVVHVRYPGAEFWCIIQRTMTTGRRFTVRTKDHSDQRVLDARTRAVLSAIAQLPKGKALDGYLRAIRGNHR